MATLEDKILGNKLHNYCSSSEDEHDDDDDDNDQGQRGRQTSQPDHLPDPEQWEGNSVNTGPKGVIRDWQRFKQLEAEAKNEQDRERIALMKKLSITCMSSEQESQQKKQDEEDKELEELLDEEFLYQYQVQRMLEMMKSKEQVPHFGQLIELADQEQFLHAVDQEHKSVTVIVHVYSNSVEGCRAMNGCLMSLCQEYPTTKFCKLASTIAGMSKQFKTSGVPALLVYKAGQMIANFIRLTDEFGEDFFMSDVENFLLEHGLLPDKRYVPACAIPHLKNTNSE